MSYSEEYKQQVYKKWLAGDRAFYHIDKSKEPTEEERQIILELGKRDKELEKRAAEIKQKYRVNEVKRFDRLMKGDY